MDRAASGASTKHILCPSGMKHQFNGFSFARSISSSCTQHAPQYHYALAIPNPCRALSLAAISLASTNEPMGG